MLRNHNKQEKILIVDDQDYNTRLIERLLERHGYMEYRSLQDSRGVLDLFKEWKPDLILLDLMMPNMDGFQVLAALRPLISEEDTLPIMIFTADVTPEAKRRALSMGASDFITKPFDAMEAMLRITNLLEIRSMHLRMRDQNALLEALVEARTADLKRQLRRLGALREVEAATAGNWDVDDVLQIVLNRLRGELEIDAAAVMLYNPKEFLLTHRIGIGFFTDKMQDRNLLLGEGCAGKIAMTKHREQIDDLDAPTDEHLCGRPNKEERFRFYIGFPLLAKNEIKGVLEIFHRSKLKPSNEWLEFVETLAGQAAVAVDNARLYKDLKLTNDELVNAYDATMEGWSRAMDLRDKETEGHTQRVTLLSLRVARKMGVFDEDMVHIKRGALLHDMGKLGIPDSILHKPGPLSDEEWVIMKKHPQFAYDMLNPVEYLRPSLDIPYAHHEKWDGSGYPRGLKGDEIPLAARIFSVVDVWDALTSDRPYRKAWTRERTLAYLQAGSGKQFDPKVIEVFVGMV